jgi:hypothetical protein
MVETASASADGRAWTRASVALSTLEMMDAILAKGDYALYGS